MSDRRIYDEAAFAADLDTVLLEVRTLLIEKNRKYGDSALNPKRMLSRASHRDLMLARMDDKHSRIMSGQNDEDEDVWLDLRGYHVLLGIYDLRANRDFKLG